MDKEKRRRAPKPDWQTDSKRITKYDKVRIAKIYEDKMRKQKSEEILGELSIKYERDVRTIWRYIKAGREIIAREGKINELRNIRSHQLAMHFSDLARIAGMLANNISEMGACSEDIGKVGILSEPDAIQEASIIYGGKVQFMRDDESIYEYEWDGLELNDTFLASLLLEHFNYQFPELAHYKDWDDINLNTIKNMKSEVLVQLRILSFSKEFIFCPACVICESLGNL